MDACESEGRGTSTSVSLNHLAAREGGHQNRLIANMAEQNRKAVSKSLGRPGGRS